ncbi:MAG TPA: hypothetical protein VHP37_25780 [Burkholderiales bacterium]|nr:hypothetical protein [Burkholderiales bacterium]
MAMERAADQQDIVDQLYFFESPNQGDTRCLILAHGGQLRGDDQFNLNGITMKFFVEHGEALESNTARLVLGLPRVNEASPCRDYSLAKFLGSHGDGKTYTQLRDLMLVRYGASPNLCPHIVSVRNRSIFKAGKIIKLSEAIRLVTAHRPAINEFWIGGCRGEHKGKWSYVSSHLWGG